MDDINFEDVLRNVKWKEFEYNNTKFRSGYYNLDGGEFLAIERFIPSDAPTEDGWVGVRWCQKNMLADNWPPRSFAEDILKQKPQKPTKEEKISNNELPFNPRRPF